MSDKKRSGWFYVFVSCGVLLLVGVIVVGAITFMAVRWAKDLKDPERRTAKAYEVAREVMGAEELPEGYHAEIALRAPLGIFTVVVLTDGEPTDGPHQMPDGDHMLLYFEGPGRNRAWKKFANGGDPPFDNLDDLNINVRRSDVIGQGELTVGKMELAYLVNRGEFSAESFSSDGIFTVILVRCPEGDRRSRTIIWAGPEGEAESVDEADGEQVAGTTGDPDRIAEMMGYFPLCGA